MAQIVLENQFGETSINQVMEGTDLPDLEPIADGTVLANISGAADLASAVTIQAFSNKSPAKTGVTSVAALSTPLSAITIALSTSDTYSDAAVNNAVNAALVTAVADMQLLVTKVNALLAALKVQS